MQEDLYCKVYVATELSRDELIKLVTTITDGEVSLRTINSPQLLIDVLSNDSFDKELMSNPGGFVYFPYFLEVEPTDEDSVELEKYKLTLKNLLVTLKGSGAQVVPSCDFENDLI